MRKILLAHTKDLRAFVLRGDLLSIAVGLALALAAVSFVETSVQALIGPIIAALFGEIGLEFMTFTINGSAFYYGAFIQAAIAFVAVGASIYFLVVGPLNAYRAEQGISAGTRSCPECASSISIAAKRCPRCTAVVPAASS